VPLTCGLPPCAHRSRGASTGSPTPDNLIGCGTFTSARRLDVDEHLSDGELLVARTSSIVRTRRTHARAVSRSINESTVCPANSPAMRR